MTGSIAEAFRELAGNGRKGLIPFITAGDPDNRTTVELIVSLADLGSTVIELGVPFTDPMADGPVIQRSSQRVLELGAGSIPSVFSIVREARKRTSVPIVLFGYLNPFYAYGIERLAADARAAGVDGFLITDIIDREFLDMASLLRNNDMDLISLVAPTTTDERLATIASGASGFIYAVSRTGVTGRGTDMSDTSRELVKRVRQASDLPVAVGFGIRTPEQVSSVLEYADAAVVGSAIVEVIEEQEGDGTISAVEDFVRRLLHTN